MTLSERQQEFAQNVAQLILYIFREGYACTFGEALRTQEMADLYAKQGKGIKNSLHLKKLAIDLNLFKDGVYLSDTESHRPFGEWWEKLDPMNRWGGRFKDDTAGKCGKLMRLIADYLLGITTVYQEAEGEPYEGKVAVAEVILRRTKRKFMSDGTVTGTCLRRLQFSGWNDASTNRIRSLKIDTDDQNVQDCIRAWTEAKAGSNLAPDCLHYLNRKLADPPWARGATLVAQIGDHSFIIPRKG